MINILFFYVLFEYTELKFCLWFCMGVKLGLGH
jgi:hypothetical protein